MQHQATKRPIPHYWLAIMLLLAIRSLAGCSPPQPQAQQRESAISGSEPSPIATAKPILPSATPAPSSTPTPTATATPSPTATASPTPRPTLTPLPTIEPQQRGQVYSELMSTNGGCVLPCWWGFELGEASLDEVRQFYMAFGAYTSEQVTRDGIILFYATFVDPLIEDGIQVSHSFVAREGVIIEAEIMVMSQPNYQIEPILQQLSQPSDVWMWTIPGPFEGFLPAHFLLYFPDQGVLFGYATSGAKVDEKVKVCFDEQGSAGLHLWDPDIWDPDGDKGIAERTSESSSAFAFEGQNSIEEVSNWDAGQFYAVLSDPAHSECLETPSELWSHP